MSYVVSDPYLPLGNQRVTLFKRCIQADNCRGGENSVQIFSESSLPFHTDMHIPL